MAKNSTFSLKENKAFSKEVPMLQLAWDSTSMGAFKTCPRYYQYSIVYGFSTKSENVHFTFGGHFHSIIEHYHKERFKGLTHQQSLNSSLVKGLELTFDKTLGRPWFSDEPAKNRETLIRSTIWYLDKFGENDSMQTVKLKNGLPAVELSFRYGLGVNSSLTDEEFFYCGHIDRLTYWQDEIWGSDYKTSKSALSQDFFQKFSPNNQISGYIFAGQVVFETNIKGFVIDGVQVGATFARFQRGIVTRTKTRLQEWFKDFQHHLQQAEICAEEEYYPMNDTSCDKFGGCPYRTVCSASPEVRDNLLTNLYSRRVWDPLTPRGGM